MSCNHIALNHQVAVMRHQELIAKAERQHEIEIAFAQNRQNRADWIVETRAIIARALIRVANRLMPEDAGRLHPPAGLELRPGR